MMAFILRSSKYVCNFLGYARQTSLTCKRKKVLLLENVNFVKFNELRARTSATVSAKPVFSFPITLEKNVSNLHNNLKSSTVDLFSVESTFSLIKESGTMLPSHLTLLLKCCGSAAFRDSEEQRVKLAKSIWETAKEFGMDLDISHYNSLISVFVENNYKFSPEEMLSEIKKSRLEPNRVTYRRLLKAFCQQGDIEGAGNLLEKIKQKNYSVNEYDFCSLIQGHCEAGELEEAKKIFKVMQDRGIKPTLEPYVYMLCGYAKHGNIQKLEELLEEMNALEIRMTDTYLLNVVYTLIINNREDHVDSILKRIKRCSDFEKTLMRVIHRLLQKRKDKEALKLFGILSNMNYVEDYIRGQAQSIVEYFVLNRSPSEVADICQKMQTEGWTPVAFSCALKKAVLRMDLDFCTALMNNFRRNGFAPKTHYFWPLIVRYSQMGNNGILSVLKAMRSTFVTPCHNTVKMFINQHYKFSGNWKADIDILHKNGARECYLSSVVLNKVLELGDMQTAEDIASSYGIFKPQRQTLTLLTKCLSQSTSHEEEKFLNILYCLAHDFYIYMSVSQDLNDGEEENELTGINTFFDEALKLLMANCSKDMFLSVLQNASKKKLIVSPEMASLICENFTDSDVDALLKDFTDSEEFELDQDLLKIKSENAASSRLTDRSGLLYLTNQNDLQAEQVWQQLGSKASLNDHLAMISMYARMKLYDKAFEVMDRLKDCSENLSEDDLRKKRFRVILHMLGQSGNLEKVIDAYNTGVRLQLIEEEYVVPVLRTILKSYEVIEAIKEYPSFFGKIKSFGTFTQVMSYVIPTKCTEAIEKLTASFAKMTNENAAYTALFTAYLANGYQKEARKLLETKLFRFQYNIFLYWFKNSFEASERSFENAMEIVEQLGPLDRTPIYAHLLNCYERNNDQEKIKMLWLQCQEDNITEPHFLENLNRCLRKIEKGFSDPENSFLQQEGFGNNAPWLEKKELIRIQELLRENKYSSETLEKLMSGKLPTRIAQKMLTILAAEGKSLELVTVVNKYRFGRFVPKIASEMLKNGKVDEFMKFVNEQASMKMFSMVYNCFASQKDLILNLIKSNEDFFQKFVDLSLLCYENGKFEALVVLLIKLCVQLPDKVSKAEELLSTGDGRIVSHFRNYALSDMLLSSTDEVDFYKNVLGSEKVKSVFSEALDHFYDRVINFYNEMGDVETVLSYLEKAKQDGVDGKLNKRLLSSIKKNLEEKGSSFPYPELVQEAA